MISVRERSAAEHRAWRTGSREIVLDRPIIAGILNVTPDSFSDGGNFFPLRMAVDHARLMIHEGADIIDVGGESTRPGAKVVPLDEELRRIVPVIRALREEFPAVAISIDTTKAAVVQAAVDAGADIVNDVSALRLDAGMADVARECGCGVVLMHSRGGVEEMASYAMSSYDGDPVAAIVSEIQTRAEIAVGRGIGRERIVLDPGFGFSKTSAHSISLLARLDSLEMLGFPLMVGVSRKRFVTEAIESGTLDNRDESTMAFNVVALMRGARIFRVHNVGLNRRALDAVWPVATASKIDES